MPEPTAAATLPAATIGVPVLTAFGVPLGLRADLLIAGFSGALVAVILLNTVPASGDTWRALVRGGAPGGYSRWMCNRYVSPDQGAIERQWHLGGRMP